MGIETLQQFVGVVGMSMLAFFGSFILIVLFYFIYRFITMSTQPREAMKAIYVYLVTFIGVVMVIMGLYSIIDLVLSAYVFSTDGSALVDAKQVWASSITNILVGGAVFYLHWQLATKK